MATCIEKMVQVAFSLASSDFLLIEGNIHEELLALNGLYAQLYETQFNREKV